jgi:hypothetical protein
MKRVMAEISAFQSPDLRAARRAEWLRSKPAQRSPWPGFPVTGDAPYEGGRAAASRSEAETGGVRHLMRAFQKNGQVAGV